MWAGGSGTGVGKGGGNTTHSVCFPPALYGDNLSCKHLPFPPRKIANETLSISYNIHTYTLTHTRTLLSKFSDTFHTFITVYRCSNTLAAHDTTICSVFYINFLRAFHYIYVFCYLHTNLFREISLWILRIHINTPINMFI